MKVPDVGDPRHVFFKTLRVEGKKGGLPKRTCKKGTDKLFERRLCKRNHSFVIGRSLDSVSNREGLGKKVEWGHYLDPDK